MKVFAELGGVTCSNCLHMRNQDAVIPGVCLICMHPHDWMPDRLMIIRHALRDSDPKAECNQYLFGVLCVAFTLYLTVILYLFTTVYLPAI